MCPCCRNTLTSIGMRLTSAQILVSTNNTTQLKNHQPRQQTSSCINFLMKSSENKKSPQKRCTTPRNTSKQISRNLSKISYFLPDSAFKSLESFRYGSSFTSTIATGKPKPIARRACCFSRRSTKFTSWPFRTSET